MRERKARNELGEEQAELLGRRQQDGDCSFLLLQFLSLCFGLVWFILVFKVPQLGFPVLLCHHCGTHRGSAASAAA